MGRSLQGFTLRPVANAVLGVGSQATRTDRRSFGARAPHASGGRQPRVVVFRAVSWFIDSLSYRLRWRLWHARRL